MVVHHVQSNKGLRTHGPRTISRSCLPMVDHSYLPATILPVGLGFFPGGEFAERGDVEDHAIIEVGVEVEVAARRSLSSQSCSW